MMKSKVLFTAIACLCVSSNASAWGQTGHRITGKIAEQYLSDEAKRAIETIIPNETLAEASTYADEMRSNKSDFWQKQAGPYHYVTVPEGKTYAEVGAPERGDSVTALKQFTRTLKDPSASVSDKQVALRFAVHIIANLHQPLHAGNGKDRGGNDFKVEFFREPSNLHRVWDSGIIDRKNLSFSEWSEWLGSKISEQQAKQWMTTDPLVYIAESTDIRDTIYPEDIELSWNYVYEHTPTVKLRLQQASVRIAAYLNDVFAQQ